MEHNQFKISNEHEEELELPAPLPENNQLDLEGKRIEAVPTLAARTAAELLSRSSDERLQQQAQQTTEQLNEQNSYEQVPLPELPLIEPLETNPTQTSSELLLRQVEAAADQNIALEKQYEQRHESKDEASGVSTASGDNAGAIRQESTSSSHALAGGSSNDGHNKPKSSLSDKMFLIVRSSMYKQAIKAGLLGAAVVIAFAIVVYIVG